MSEPKKITRASADQAEDKSEQTAADKLWNQIKDKKIDLFSLPGETVAMYCKPATVEPSRLYLQPKTAAVFPALEAALGPKFLVEMKHKYLCVSVVPDAVEQASDKSVVVSVK